MSDRGVMTLAERMVAECRAVSALIYAMGQWRHRQRLAELGITEEELHEGRQRWPWEE